MERYTQEQLLELLDDIESDRVERKSSFKGDVPNKARQAICAFANDLPGHNKPGVLFIGAQDDGSASNEPEFTINKNIVTCTLYQGNSQKA